MFNFVQLVRMKIHIILFHTFLSHLFICFHMLLRVSWISFMYISACAVSVIYTSCTDRVYYFEYPVCADSSVCTCTSQIVFIIIPCMCQYCHMNPHLSDFISFFLVLFNHHDHSFIISWF